MDTLKRKRGNQKGGLSRLQTLCSERDISVCNSAEAEVYLERIEKLMVDFEHTQNEIESLAEDPNNSEEEAERTAFENKYFYVKSYCKRVIQLKEASERVSNSPSTSNLDDTIRTLVDNQSVLSTALGRLVDHDSTHIGDNNNMMRSLTENQTTLNEAITMLTNFNRETGNCSSRTKLPNINIPIFTGDYRDWFSFKDLYVSLVHNSSSLTGSQKLQYLKSFLRGEAASMLKHIPVSDANYELGWSQLVERYNREKVVIEAHIKSIMEQPVIAQPSLVNIKRLYCTTNESVLALKALNEPVGQWDSILNVIVVNKLDSESRQLWARESADKERPTFDELLKFISKRQYEMENMPTKKGPISARNLVHAVVAVNCEFCKGLHGLAECKEFLNLGIDERRNLVYKQRICYNCLQPGHAVKQCKLKPCSLCKRRHHMLIHPESPTGNQMSSSYENTLNKATSFTGHHTTNRLLVNSADKLLPTALVYVEGFNGQIRLCRVMLDSGSQVTLISEECVQGLGLKRSNARQTLDGVGNFRNQSTRGSVVLKVRSRTSCFSIKLSALIMSSLSIIPHTKLNLDVKRYVTGLTLADPRYDKPSAIDIILSASVVFNVIKDGQIRNSNGSTVLQNSHFGWLISSGNEETFSLPHSLSCQVLLSDNVDVLLQRFWELDEPTHKLERTTEHITERHFMENHTRDHNGRYVVKFPFKEDRQPFGDSKVIALRRFRAMERKFVSNKELQLQYVEFMDEYAKLGHMKELTDSEKRDSIGAYYMPHHAVMKPSSTTTKLRVVFDASCPTTNNISLNSQLLAGPVIQRDLITMLMQFRNYKIGISADIAKMYRQIWVAAGDTNLQRIFWRTGTDGPIREYKLLTLTYGTTPASFLATRVLQQLATDDGHRYPKARNMLMNNFYMDDFMSGCDNEEEAEQIFGEVCELLHAGGFDLRKWSSNSIRLREIIPEDKREPSWNLTLDKNEVIKTLGLHWYPARDVFGFKVNLEPVVNTTKRCLLQEMARVFDPLGFIAPCLLQYKILLQKIWKEKKLIDWDDKLPVQFAQEWMKIRADLPSVEKLSVPRWSYNKGNMELHGFADASKLAYGAVVYLRSVLPDEQIRTSLILAKTKVAPISKDNEPSIARLELCAACLLIKLFIKLKETDQYKDIPCFGWTDSSVTYFWIRSDANRWGTFIANRVWMIQDILPGDYWHHIRTEQNPADCASRGMKPSKLVSHQLWWRGPAVLHTNPIALNDNFSAILDENQLVEKEARKMVMMTAIINQDDIWEQLLKKFSSWSMLIRVTAYVCRFINNVSRKVRREGYLTTNEIKEAEDFWVKKAQMKEFAEEYRDLQNKQVITRNSKLISLNPFLDDAGMLRIGGRLSNSSVPFQQQHPIILNKGLRIVELIVSELHHKYLHAGPQLLLAVLRNKYWVLGAKVIIRSIVHKCPVCQRYKGKSIQQQMGNLPSARLEPGRAFLNTGIDYAGPFSVLPRRSRGARSVKSYIALFVCCATRAIHLEAVFDLSTASFLAALKRFVSRRGVCWSIYSDNATNFTGARRELAELKKLIASNDHQERVTKYLASLDIKWHFIPVASPNFGGSWESAVKSVKFHLRRVAGSSLLTIEEFGTLLCEIEACLNSRPLTPLPSTSDDFAVLTPAHFLVNGPLLLLPQENLEDAKISHLSRWQYVTRLQQEFWRKWHMEYLVELQRRNKWRGTRQNLELDDLVIIKEDNLPPGKWLLGRVIQTHKGSDGLVRVVSLRTKNGTTSRAVSKLCPLFAEN